MRTIIPKNAKLIPAQATLVFKGQIFDVYQWQQELFDGSNATFEMLKRPDTLKVIAIKDDKIVLLDEQQPGHDSFYDFPGGRHDYENESELEAAKREVLEETGMSFANWKLVKINQPHSKIDWLVYIFVASDFIDQQKPKLDAGEKIETKLVDLNELKSLLNSPKARYNANDILDQCNTIEDLLNLPPQS